jgi:alpha-glucosidase
VPARGQFYYHFFYKQQPDLNWRNPAVEKAMFAAMRFWLDRGVAGFRLDAITTLFEDPKLRDEPLTGRLDPSGFPEANHTRTSGLPEVHDVLRRLRKMTDSYPDNRVLVGEIYVPGTADLLTWYGTPSQPELQLPMDTLVGFHTEGNGQPESQNVQLSLRHFRQAITGMETELSPAGVRDQPLLVFDNHDNARSWDRFGAGATPENKASIARIIATILYTTRSTALTYYGAEIGMTTHTPTRKQDVRDPIGITGWPKEKGRDGERTPMQWTSDPPAGGFSTNPHTWLPIGADYPTVNVQSETGDPDSLLTWTHRLIDYRRGYPALRDGGFLMLDEQNPSVLTYVRTAPRGQESVLISLNFTDQPQTVHLDLAAAGLGDHYAWIIMNLPVSLKQSLTTFTLPPYASLIAGLQ